MPSNEELINKTLINIGKIELNVHRNMSSGFTDSFMKPLGRNVERCPTQDALPKKSALRKKYCLFLYVFSFIAHRFTFQIILLLQCSLCLKREKNHCQSSSMAADAYENHIVAKCFLQ